ncbi:MAG: hypothetical protein P8181_18060, partial [bacterium]
PDTAEVVGLIEEFFRARTETFLKERGFANDVVAAVAAVSWSEPGIALQRARAIRNLKGDRAFELLITGVKRVGNILAPDLKRFGTSWDVLEDAFVSAPGTAFDPALFEDDSERRLYDAVRRAIPQMIQFDAVSDVSSILAVLSELGPAIDEFFDRVLVNCADEKLRRNRHRFLSAVFSLFAKYADFSLYDTLSAGLGAKGCGLRFFPQIFTQC